jgi:adenylate kinase family enzyme
MYITGLDRARIRQGDKRGIQQDEGGGEDRRRRQASGEGEKRDKEEERGEEEEEEAKAGGEAKEEEGGKGEQCLKESFPPPPSEANTNLIVGISGSGKSTFALKLLLDFSPHQCLIVNSSSDSVYEKLKEKNIKIIEKTWDEIIPEKIERNTCILFDDCYGYLKQKEIRKLTRILNVICRHKNCPVILVTHSVVSNHFSPLLNFFKNIYVSQNPRNRNTFESMMKSLKMDKKRRGEIIENFLEKGERRNDFYFIFCEKKTGEYEAKNLTSSNVKANEPENQENAKRESLIKRGDTYFKIWKHQHFGNVLFSWILDVIDVGMINEKDFTVPVFFCKKEYKVNLIQFCFDIIKKEKVACYETFLLLNYLIVSHDFPQFFIKNPYLMAHYRQVVKDLKKSNQM